MSEDTVIPNKEQEKKDLELRQTLQMKLQTAIRNSSSSSEIARIEAEIRALNVKLESYASHTRKT